MKKMVFVVTLVALFAMLVMSITVFAERITTANDLEALGTQATISLCSYNNTFVKSPITLMATKGASDVTDNSDHTVAIMWIASLAFIVVVLVVVILLLDKKDGIRSQPSSNEVDECNSNNTTKAFTYCKNCGEKLPLDSDYCHMCGTRINRLKTSKKKVLIVIACIVVASILYRLLGLFIIPGFLGAVVFWLIVSFVVKSLCNKLDENEKAEVEEEATSEKLEDKLISDSLEIVSGDIPRYCRKCGAKLIEDSQFCRKCGTEVITIDESDDRQ